MASLLEGDGMTFDETSAAAAPDIAQGKYWVKNTTPSKPYFTDDTGTSYDLTVAGDATAIHVDVDAEISGITEKVTPVAADLIVIEDSAAANAKKRVQLGNLPGGGSHALLSATHTDSVVNTVSRGSLIYGNVTPAWDELVVGTGLLHADGTDVTGWSLVVTADITDDNVTYAKIQNVVANNVLLGNNAGAGGIVDELTGTEVTALLDNFVGDSGAGGTKGLVPAPGAGDAAAGKYLDADGTWTVPPGGSSPPFVDTTSIVEGSADNTKELRFEVDGNTTGIIGVIATQFTTAKTWTIPDAADTSVGRDTTDTLTNKTLTTPTIGDFTNATHNHEAAAGGGTLASAATPTAIHDDTSGEINAITTKASPVSADVLVIEDSAASFAKKKITIGSLPAGGEVNNLAGDGIQGIADDQLAVGTGASTAAYQTLPNGAVAYSTAGGTFSQADWSQIAAFAGNVTADLTGAATRTWTLQNSTASQVANMDVDGVYVWRNGHATGTFTFAGTPTAARTITWQDASDTVVMRDTTDTLTNKTLTTPTIGSFTNATHNHEAAAGGGTLASAATPSAIHDDTGGEFAAITEKVSPVSGDLLLIEDSAASNAKKYVQIGNLPGGGGGNTLDQAYDQGGAGAGRTITADSNAVFITATSVGGDDLLDVFHNASGTLTANSTDSVQLRATREHTGATTVTDDYAVVKLTRTNISNNASANLTANGAVLEIENVATQTLGTLTDNTHLLDLRQDVDASSGAHALGVFNGSESFARVRITAGGAIGFDTGGLGNFDTIISRSGVGILNVVNVVDANTGFRVNALAPTGNVLRGNGTNFVSATLASTDLSDSSSLVTLTGTQTLTNKTYTLPIISLDQTLASNGQLTIDSTNDQFKYRSGAADHVIMPFRLCGIPFTGPATADENIVLFTEYAITIEEFKACGRGGTSIAWEARFDTDADNAGTLIEGNTTTMDGTMYSYTTLTDATIPAGQIIWIELDTVTGTVADFTLQFRYTVDAT